MVSDFNERPHDPAIFAANVRQPHEGHDHLGPIKPCISHPRQMFELIQAAAKVGANK